MLLGLTGYAGSGKDAAAAGLLRLGWTRLAFADPLKEIATRIGWDGTKDDSGRRLLQDLGLAVRDVIDPDAWVHAAARSLSRIEGSVVVTDVRFANEAEWLSECGGRLIRIDRPGVGPANGHVSERIDGLFTDAVVVNDGSLEQLEQRLVEAVASLSS